MGLISGGAGKFLWWVCGRKRVGAMCNFGEVFTIYRG
jgi:hypothetical protein